MTVACARFIAARLISQKYIFLGAFVCATVSPIWQDEQCTDKEDLLIIGSSTDGPFRHI